MPGWYARGGKWLLAFPRCAKRLDRWRYHVCSLKLAFMHALGSFAGGAWAGGRVLVRWKYWRLNEPRVAAAEFAQRSYCGFDGHSRPARPIRRGSVTLTLSASSTSTSCSFSFATWTIWTSLDSWGAALLMTRFLPRRIPNMSSAFWCTNN